MRLNHSECMASIHRFPFPISSQCNFDSDSGECVCAWRWSFCILLHDSFLSLTSNFHCIGIFQSDALNAIISGALAEKIEKEKKKTIRQFNFDGLTIKPKSFLFHLNRNELRDFQRHWTPAGFAHSTFFSLAHSTISRYACNKFSFTDFFFAVSFAQRLSQNQEDRACRGTSDNFLDTIRYKRCTPKW